MIARAATIGENHDNPSLLEPSSTLPTDNYTITSRATTTNHNEEVMALGTTDHADDTVGGTTFTGRDTGQNHPSVTLSTLTPNSIVNGIGTTTPPLAAMNRKRRQQMKWKKEVGKVSP